MAGLIEPAATALAAADAIQPGVVATRSTAAAAVTEPGPAAVAFTALTALVGVERIAELVVSKRHERWSRARGGVEYGRGHYPLMVLCHTGLLAGAVTEVWVAGRPFLPVLAATMLALVLGSQALRWWCVASLGTYWNTRVIIVPGDALVRAGPYRWLRHPNYVAVVIEGIALPLVHSAWLTALCFTLVNAVVLAVRLRVENAALAQAPLRSRQWPPTAPPDARTGLP